VNPASFIATLDSGEAAPVLNFDAMIGVLVLVLVAILFLRVVVPILVGVLVLSCAALVVAAVGVALWGWVCSAFVDGWGSAQGPYSEYSPPPAVAGNGDRLGWDNDGDGDREWTYVRPHKRNTTRVRGHYRK